MKIKDFLKKYPEIPFEYREWEEIVEESREAPYTPPDDAFDIRYVTVKTGELTAAGYVDGIPERRVVFKRKVRRNNSIELFYQVGQWLLEHGTKEQIEDFLDIRDGMYEVYDDWIPVERAIEYCRVMGVSKIVIRLLEKYLKL